MTVKAPWSADIVERLNAHQSAGFLHPYTCGKCGDNLVATEAGWHCPGEHGDPLCDYTQTWAHEPPTLEVLAAWNPVRLIVPDAARPWTASELTVYVGNRSGTYVIAENVPAAGDVTIQTQFPLSPVDRVFIQDNMPVGSRAVFKTLPRAVQES